MTGELTPKIFLGDQRTQTEGEVLRCRSVQPADQLASLILFSDEVVPGSVSAEYIAERDLYVILLPVTGGLCIEQKGRAEAVDVGQMKIRKLSKGDLYSIINPFQGNSIHYLHIQVASESPNVVDDILNFNFTSRKDRFIAMEAKHLPFRVNLVQMTARQEWVYRSSERGSLQFCYAVSGAFEVEGRLLHPGDGLSLWNVCPVEAEALSDNAVFLLIELNNIK